MENYQSNQQYFDKSIWLVNESTFYMELDFMRCELSVSSESKLINPNLKYSSRYIYFQEHNMSHEISLPTVR